MKASNRFEDVRVLYLEDEPLISFDTTDFLKDLGFLTVKSVSKLAAAEQAVADQIFELAILDINVDKKQTSLALGTTLSDKGTKVIFASGNSSDAQRLRGQGFCFLDKPFSYNLLETTILAALEKSEA